MLSTSTVRAEQPYLTNRVSHESENDTQLQIERFGNNPIKDQNVVCNTVSIKRDTIEEDEKEDDESSLPWFDAALFAKILEDSLKEINILANCNNEIRVTKAISDKSLFFTIKYKLDPSDAKEITRIKNNRNFDDDKLNKYDADRKYFTKVITDTYICLNLRKKYSTLTEEINKVLSREQDRIDKIDQEAKNILLSRELHKQLRHQRNYYKTLLYDANATKDTLTRKVQDFCLNAEHRFRYIDNWQRARTEQNDQSIYDSESYPSGIIEYFKQRYDQEHRVHSELVLLTNVSIDETSEKVEEWMNKYDKDMEGIDLKIQFKRNTYQTTLEKREELEDILEKHDILIKEWKHFKEERDKARKYIADMTKSAIIAQAWWRGILVRRKLGPYKPKKKKKEKDNPY